MMIARRAVLVAALTAVVALNLAIEAAGAEEAPAEPVATVLELSLVEPLQPELPYRVAASLRTVDGSAVTGAPVHFSIVTSLLGGRAAGLGSATTDAAGGTNVPIQPRDTQLDIAARFTGTATHAATDVTSTIDFPEAAVVRSGPLHETHSLLAPVRELMPGVISGLVAVLWVFLIGSAVWAVRRIRREALPTEPAASGPT